MKSKALAFILALLFSALVVTVLFGAVQASSIPKPSVPEFTVKYVDNSYDVPPRYDFDPYTGKNVTIEPGYHVQNKTIELAIRNQPFTSYEDTKGNIVRLYYSVRVKGHFGDSWYYPSYSSYAQVDYAGARVDYRGANRDSDYTVIEYGLVGNNSTRSLRNLQISAGGKADFQVQAFIGYSVTIEGTPDPLFGRPTYTQVFTGETSDWSETQTITVSESQTPVPSPTITPEQTEIIVGAAMAAVVIGVFLGLLIYFIKRK